MDSNNMTKTINMAKQGDRKAFGELYTAHYDSIYKFVLKKVGNKETAEDITQDIFMQSFESIGSLSEPEKYLPWLYSIANHKCADHFRLKNKNYELDNEQAILSEHTAFPDDPVMLPDDYCVNTESADKLRQIIDTLKPDMKKALILYYYDDLSISKVAKKMGTSENAVKQKLYRARKRLGAEIKKLEQNGAAFTLVPMRELLHIAVDDKAAAVKPHSLTTTGAQIAAVKIVGMIAAAALAISVPIGLYFTEHKLNDHNNDSRIDIESSVTIIESSKSETESSQIGNESSKTNTESSSAKTESSETEPESSIIETESSESGIESSRIGTESSRSEVESSRIYAESSRTEPESRETEPESSITETESSETETESSITETESSESEIESSITEAESSETEIESSPAEIDSSITEDTDTGNTDTDSRIGVGRP